MNENQPNQSDQSSVPAPAPAPDSASDPAPAPTPRRRRAGVIAGCVVLLAALVGGTGYTVSTVRAADRAPGAPVWRLPKSAAGQRPAPATGLKAMLLPYGTQEFVRGPDMGEFGNDAELSGAQATQLRKDALRNLPRSQRRQLSKEIDKQHVKGMVMRSYINDGAAVGGNSYAEKAYTVQIVLSRMGSSRTVRSIAGYQQQFFETLRIFRAGPKIEGHKNARCFLPPADSKEKLDAMICSGYEGDVLVSATMQAVKPLDTEDAARMFSKQLDRIKVSGQAV